MPDDAAGAPAPARLTRTPEPETGGAQRFGWADGLRRLLFGRREHASRSYRFLARLIDREYPATAGGVCLAVTSPDADRLATHVLLMLAYCLQSELDRRVLIVDARVSDPADGVTGRLGMAGHAGTADVLGEPRLPDVWPIRPSAVPNVDVLPVGRLATTDIEPSGLRRLGGMVSVLRPRYGYVLLQAGPVLDDTRNLVCCAQADAVLLVAEERRTLMRVLDECRSLLESHGVGDVRVVLANAGG